MSMNFPLTKRDYVTRGGRPAHVSDIKHGRAIGHVDLPDSDEGDPRFVTMDWSLETGLVWEQDELMDYDIVAEMEGGAE